MVKFTFTTPIHPPFGAADEFAIWVNGVNMTKKVFTHKTYKRINNLWRARIMFLGLEESDKTHVDKEKIVKIFADNEIIFRGKIDDVEYDSDYAATIKAKGMASKLMKDTTNQTYSSTATETIFTALVNTDRGIILDTTDNGSYGNVTVRFDDENNLKGIKDLTYSIDYDWWEEWGTYPYDTPTIHIKSSKGTTNSYTFNATGSDANMTTTSKEVDTNNMLNSIIILGAGDGITQKKAEYFYATDTRSTLSSALTATATTVSLTDASSFPSSGNVWIGCEKITYTGKSSNDLTGCTRGVAFMGNVEKTENVKDDTRGYAHDAGIAVYDAQYTKASPESSVGMDEDNYGLHETSDARPEIINQNVLDRLAQNIVDAQKDPIERIVIEPLDTFTILGAVDVGDSVSVTDSASDLSGSYRIVGVITGYDENKAEFIRLELSNKKISFEDDILLVQDETKKLGSYTQGVTTIYAVTHADNCDNSKALNVRFPIPAEVVAVSQVKLNFKIKPFRAYNDASQTAASATNAGTWAYDQATNDNTVSVTANTLTGSDGGEFWVFVTEGSDTTLKVQVWDSTISSYLFEQNITFDAQQGIFQVRLPYQASLSAHSLTLSTEDMAGSDFDVDSLTIGVRPTKFTHTHTITMTYGIYEDTTPSGNVVVTCGEEASEASVGTYSSDQSEVDITQQVKDAVTVGTLSWLNCKFAPATENMRIEASIYIEVSVRR